MSFGIQFDPQICAIGLGKIKPLRCRNANRYEKLTQQIMRIPKHSAGSLWNITNIANITNTYYKFQNITLAHFETLQTHSSPLFSNCRGAESQSFCIQSRRWELQSPCVSIFGESLLLQSLFGKVEFDHTNNQYVSPCVSIFGQSFLLQSPSLMFDPAVIILICVSVFLCVSIPVFFPKSIWKTGVLESGDHTDLCFRFLLRVFSSKVSLA